MAHAKRIEFETDWAPERFNLWDPSSRNAPSLEREPWRALRSSAAIHFVGPSWWREWDAESLPQQLKDELLITLECRWAVCVAYWRLQSHGSLDQVIRHALELEHNPLIKDSNGVGQPEGPLASKLDLVVHGGLLIRVKKTGRINFTFEAFGKRLIISAGNVRTLARQFCIAAAQEFDHAPSL